MTISPSNNGWVKKYFSLIKNYESVLNKFPGNVLNTEELIYAILQPTGFLYGHPTGFIFLDNSYLSKFTEEEALKILLLEGLVLVDYINCGNLNHENLELTIDKFVEFYESTNLEKAKKSWLNFSKLDTCGKLESIISQRVEIKGNITDKFITNFLSNGLLFHDLILYYNYVDEKYKGNLVDKRAEILLDLVKVVAVAAHADGQISDEEKGVFKLFLASANLGNEKKEIAEKFFENNKTLKDIDFSENSYFSTNSWLLNRYVLEMAILTIWSDKGVTQSEKNFLNELTVSLRLKAEDKDNSYIAIQTFVLNNQTNALFLNGKNDVEIILSGASKRWAKILGRNKDKLASELKQSKELVGLITKSSIKELTKEEKEKVKTQFYDLAKTIPSLALFMLPGGAVILPVVLKIIPNLVPSAFVSNKIDNEEE